MIRIANHIIIPGGSTANTIVDWNGPNPTFLLSYHPARQEKRNLRYGHQKSYMEQVGHKEGYYTTEYGADRNAGHSGDDEAIHQEAEFVLPALTRFRP